MHAFTANRYGGPEVLTVGELPIPAPASDQVRIRVVAASVNPLDWHELRGEPWLVRLRTGLRRPKQTVPGNDVAGIVDAVGDGVDELRVGDRVFGSATGGFCPWALGRPASLAIVPTDVGPTEAASLPVAGCTALQAVRLADVGSGSRVLVIGASGGVGTFAVQLLVSAGASVVGVCSTRNVDLVRSLGADDVVDHTTGGLDELCGPFDAIVDSVGSLSFRRCKKLLRHGGVHVVVGGPDGGRLLGPLTHLARSKLSFVVGGRRSVPFLATIRTEDLDELGRLVADGSLIPVIEHTFGTHEVPGAIRHVETRRTRGKVVIAGATTWPVGDAGAVGA